MKQNNKCEICDDDLVKGICLCCKMFENKESHSQKSFPTIARASEEKIKLERTDILQSGLVTPSSSPSSVPYTPLTKEDFGIFDGITGCRSFQISNAKDLEEAKVILKSRWVKEEKFVSALNGLRNDINQYYIFCGSTKVSKEDIDYFINKWFNIGDEQK